MSVVHTPPGAAAIGRSSPGGPFMVGGAPKTPVHDTIPFGQPTGYTNPNTTMLRRDSSSPNSDGTVPLDTSRVQDYYSQLLNGEVPCYWPKNLLDPDHESLLNDSAEQFGNFRPYISHEGRKDLRRARPNVERKSKDNEDGSAEDRARSPAQSNGNIHTYGFGLRSPRRASVSNETAFRDLSSTQDNSLVSIVKPNTVVDLLPSVDPFSHPQYPTYPIDLLNHSASSFRSQESNGPASHLPSALDSIHLGQQFEGSPFREEDGRHRKERATVTKDLSTKDEINSNPERRTKIKTGLLRSRHGWQDGAEKFLWGEPPALTSKLTKKRSLGDGRLGKVEEVMSANGSLTMARKRVFVHHFREKRAKALIKQIEGEVASLKRLSHPHIVSIIGCYQEEEGNNHLNIYTLMQPVGDGDLKTFLEDRAIRCEEWAKKVEKWFMCLASALAYMHSQHVHHEDIKPNNIIHRRGTIFFTDFSSSRRLNAGDQTSTTSEALATRLFAAPEAFRNEDGEILAHGSKTDVFSLGLVFVELLVFLTGTQIDSFRKHVFYNYKSGSHQYHRVSHKFDGFFDPDDKDFPNVRLIYRDCIEYMLRKERTARPSAKNVFAKMKRTRFFKVIQDCECKNKSVEMGDSDTDTDWEYLEARDF